MEVILNETVSPSDLQKFKAMYVEQSMRGVASEKAQFEYAWCLVRSTSNADMKEGVALLEDLFKRTVDDDSRRDYLYYMAIGYTRIKEYQAALKYTNAILKFQPQNHQAQELQRYIKKKMDKEGLLGIAIVGGITLAIGGIIGIALAKK